MYFSSSEARIAERPFAPPALIAAANRDPEHFPDPVRFDVTRTGSSPMAYGLGIHFCLGWRLANLQAEVVFPAMLNRFAGLEITGAGLEEAFLALTGGTDVATVCA